MVKNNLRIGLYIFLISVLIGTSTSVVYAAYASSDWKYYGPIKGFLYENEAVVYSDAYALTVCLLDQEGRAPTGYMGARARLYDSSGTLLKDSGWIYNNEPLAGILQETDTYSRSGTYYSKGITAAYNGDGYNTYATYQSPNITR